MIKIISKCLLSGLLLISISSCGKESYLYLQKSNTRNDTVFPVKEMKGSSSVDVLWIIDNSGSMGSYQSQVISNAGDFMKDFIKEKLNWKMGLISTDEGDQPYGGFKNSQQLDSTVADPVGTFVSMVGRLGTSGDAEEKTFDPILKALRNDPGFLRVNSPLAVIMVTDAEEQSNIDANNFISSLSSYTAGRNIFAYGVFAPDDFGCDGEIWDYAGSPYETFIKSAYVGQVYPLCKDFGTSLANIGHDIVTRVAHNAIYLSSRPDTTTLKVLYQEKELPAGPTETGGFWVYDYRLNAIVFNNLEFAKNDTDSVRVIFEEVR